MKKLLFNLGTNSKEELYEKALKIACQIIHSERGKDGDKTEEELFDFLVECAKTCS